MTSWKHGFSGAGVALIAVLATGCDVPSSSKDATERGRYGLTDGLGDGMERGWTSSGGELANDGINPWWLANTTALKYCVVVDAATVSVDAGAVDTQFQRALTYWRDQFTADFGEKIATQTFERVGCEQGDVDLQIQVGEGTLDRLQKTFLAGHLDRIVGVTVRTHYDRVNLRGRGFIYLRSDAGDASAPWSQPSRLYRVLSHEAGHIFGVGHRSNSIMDEGAAAYWFGHDAKSEELAPFSRLPETLEICLWNVGYFFFKDQAGVEGDTAWGHYRLTREGYDLRIAVADLAMDHAAPYEEAGIIKSEGGMVYALDSSVRIFLPAEQTVVTAEPDAIYAYGNIYDEQLEFNLFRSDAGWQKPLLFTYGRGKLHVNGVLGNSMTNLFEASNLHGQWMFDEMH